MLEALARLSKTGLERVTPEDDYREQISAAFRHRLIDLPVILTPRVTSPGQSRRRQG